MIKSYKQLTWKYLNQNKKRTALTIVGIILSVALISAIGFFFRSMQAAQIQDIKNSQGAMHLTVNNYDETILTKIKSNPSVEKSGIYSQSEIINISDTLSAVEIHGSDEALELLPLKLKEGRYPNSPSETALEGWFIDKIQKGAKVGDLIKIAEKQYTLVGIINDNAYTQSNVTGQIILKNDSKELQKGTLLVRMKPSKNMQSAIDDIRKLTDQKNISVNEALIEFESEGMPKELIGALAIIISIVVISTIVVIYNSFQISVVERVKQFGLLRAIGATPKQIRNIILKEATFLAVVGIPIGILFGVIALYSIFLIFKYAGGELIATIIYPEISLDVVLISVLVGVASTYASAMVPAFFAGRISPLVAISSRNSIAKEKLKKRRSFLTSKIFGFEGSLASKNIRRNKKRYRTTVLSILISVTLFITFKSFMDLSLNVYSDTNESSKLHFAVETNSADQTKIAAVKEETINKISNLSDVRILYKGYGIQNYDAVININREVNEIKQISDVYKEINYEGELKAQLQSVVQVYDEKALEASKAYLKEGTIDVQKLNDEQGVIIVGKNMVYNKSTKNFFYGGVADLKVGDYINLQKDDTQNVAAENGQALAKKEFGKGEVKKVKVLAILEDDPFYFSGELSNLKIITTEQVASKLSGGKLNPINVSMIIKDTDKEKEVKESIESIINLEGNLTLINIIDQNRVANSAILMIKFLMYGFVVVVSLIGSVNIVNTLTTNIILRRREFAALRAIGLTQKGLRNMITLEGMLYGMTGTLYGSILGSGFSYLIYKQMYQVREQAFILPYEAIFIAGFGAMLIGLISVLAPLNRIKKENLIETIREDY